MLPIAGALQRLAVAKTQVELTNPEKSLVATIRPPLEGERSFPLCAAVERVGLCPQEPWQAR
jgi:hypothetical protein